MNHVGVAQKEAVKREVNEAIEDGLSTDRPTDLVRMRCECGLPECIAFVSITLNDYESIRQHPRRFVIADGHQVPEVENVIDRTPRYLVVEKIGLAGAIVEDSDPRAPDEPTGR